MTNKELDNLEYVWNEKLKEAGFENIEMWRMKYERKFETVKFIKGHIRWDDYKNITNFTNIMHNKEEYYRIIGIYAHHGPTFTVMELYRDILKELAMTGNMAKAIRNCGSDVKISALGMFLKRNFQQMSDFVRNIDKEQNNE